MLNDHRVVVLSNTKCKILYRISKSVFTVFVLKLEEFYPIAASFGFFVPDRGFALEFWAMLTQ